MLLFNSPEVVFWARKLNMDGIVECKPLDLSQLEFVMREYDLCGNQDGKLFYSVPFFGRSFCFVRCPACGLVYQNPMLDKKSLKKYL